MCISLIGGTVPDYVRGMERNVDAAIAGGFTARCIFIFEDKKSKELPYAPTIEENPASAALYTSLKHDLEWISKNVKGEYKLTPDARLAFEKFYPSTTPQGEDSDAMLNFKARMRTHVYKMAMILAAARKDKMIIDGQDIKDAVHLVKSVKMNLDKVFRGTGTSVLSEATGKIQSYLERNGMATKSELLRVMHRHMHPDALDKVLWILEQIGWAREVKMNSKIYYQAVPKIVQGIGLKP